MREATGQLTWILAAIFLCLLACRSAEAVNPETLLMPGKLTSAHAKYEESCANCHDKSDRGRQPQLCLSCHKEVAADISVKKGFHGKLAGASTSTQCRACHSEHLGRDADIVKFSRDQFDHERTDFPLHGAHAAVTCDSCHAAGKKYTAAPSDCYTCHRTREPHEGRLGRDCASCHDSIAWSRINFDHDKTAFPLRDKHKDVACFSCHFGNRYKSTPQQCVSCHAPDDVHRGERGPKCADCHSTAGWKTAKFDHLKETGFALEGIHARLDCADCHRSGRLKDPLPKTCEGCHKGVDAHAGRFGEKCETCHGKEKWLPAVFDHTRDTKWPLEGRHEKVDCHACHTGVLATQHIGTDCAACHRARDVHSGKLGTDCAQCHTPAGWRVNVAFDHDLTAFPLVGLHVAVPCEQCHVTRAYKGAAKACIDCHRTDDAHNGSLGNQCARCHSANGWRIWEFDHGKETHFALTGAHSKVTCAGCHKQPADQVKLDTACAYCHTQDDVHLGQYGRQCSRCHTTLTFKGARPR
jgi:hypothetical protein